MDKRSREHMMSWSYLRLYTPYLSVGTFLLAAVYIAMLVLLPSLLEQRIARKIISHGGSVAFQSRGTNWVPRSIQSRIPFCSRIESVTLEGEAICDTLPGLGSLTDLKALDLIQTQITDDELKHLKDLTHLETLILVGSQVTDGGLQHLRGMTRLRTLVIGGAQINDSGLENLKGLTNLKLLNLSRTHITDPGLRHLSGLVNLQWLDLNETQVTTEGRGQLRKSLPGCRVIPEP